jgi:hypothetical protein
MLKNESAAFERRPVQGLPVDKSHWFHFPDGVVT